MAVLYDDFAETFGKSRDGLHWPEIDILLDHFLTHKLISESWEIADIGCGNGRLLEHMLQYNPEEFTKHRTRYTGLDLSSELLAQARLKFISSGKCALETEWILWNMTELDTLLPAEQQFDAVFLIASFHHLADPVERKKVLTDISSHLKTGARIYMTNWNLVHESQWRYQSSLTRSFPDGSADFMIKIGEHERFYHAFSDDSFQALVRDAGYSCEMCDFSGRNSIAILGRQN